MKKVKIILCFILILNGSFQRINIFAQNLVPNPSFENTNSSVDTIWGGCSLYTGGFASYLNQEPPWDSPTNGSPDPFDTCSHPLTSASVPLSMWGFQQAHTGGGHAAEVFYTAIEWREYIQVELDTPLIANETYCASFYINRADSSKIACNNFGMYFSTTHTFIANQLPLPFIPQINDTNIVTDSVGWTLIYGQYRANGGERYIIIGNFYSDSLTDTVQVYGHPHTNQQNVAYYFIDDVNVHCCLCDSASNVSHVGIYESNKEEYIEIYPNPGTNELTIELKNIKAKSIKVINVLGEVVINKEKAGVGKMEVNVGNLAKGIYFVEVEIEEGILRRKFVKE